MGGVDKIMAPLMGRPLIAHSVQVFNDSPLIGTIVLVVSPRNIERGRRLVEDNGWNKVSDVRAGGERRQESVRRGLDRIRDTDWTVVHDCARPCITTDMIARGLAEVQQTGAAVAAVPVKDTIKSVGPDLVVTHTLARDGLWAVQTPQLFKTDLLFQAHRDVSQEVTDDATLVELIGGAVKIFMGSHENIKVTTPADILIAEAILKGRALRLGGRSQ
jgi:2-C-methyl-D-erythritol 4-phosphate cytidylyltransferase